MSCKLYIPFSVSADHLLKSVQIQASKFQAKFDGNENSGDFKVRALLKAIMSYKVRYYN